MTESLWGCRELSLVHPTLEQESFQTWNAKLPLQRKTVTSHVNLLAVARYLTYIQTDALLI
jgi:hypothetical protein